MKEFFKVSYVVSPLLLGLIFHGLCIKFGWLTQLSRPIDQGLTVRGKRLFGENKTYRGLAVVAIGTAIGFALQFALHQLGVAHELEILDYGRPAVVALGFSIGVAAMLSELPNSLLKRQLDIAPGGAGGGIAGVLFYVLDQVDMLIGVWIVLGFAAGVTFIRVLFSVIFLFVIHQIFTVAGYYLGMRATVR
jgi:hypothetical protein